jgi:hypothetical protein
MGKEIREVKNMEALYATMEEIFGEPIYAYTAEDALEDGMLVDVTYLAKDAGFNWAVRITNTVFDLCTPDEYDHEDYTGRLWDILNLARLAIRASDDDRMTTFTVRLGDEDYELWAVMDTTSGPAIHIMRPEDY